MVKKLAPCNFRHRSFSLAAAFLMCALASASPPSTILNDRCPVMAEEKVDPAITLNYRGKVVAFCCDMCVKKFQANPEKYKGRLPQFAEAANAAADGQIGDLGHDHTDVPGHSGQDGLGTHGTSSGEATSVSVAESGHDHSDIESGNEREPFLGRLHPIIIHFPIAGLPLALLSFLVWVRTGRE